MLRLASARFSHAVLVRTGASRRFVASVISGTEVSKDVRRDVAAAVSTMQEKYGERPGLAVVLVRP